jgi:hypothetical protein
VAAKNLRESFSGAYGGNENRHKTKVIEEGMELEKLGFPPEEAQMIEARRFQIENLARLYRMPPHIIQDLSRATFSNIEEQNIDFVIDSLIPWLKIWEQELWRKLLTPEEQEVMFFEFNVMALLRGNSAGRAAYLQTMLTNGVMNRNEARALDNLNPVEGGDVFLVQGAMAPVDLLVERMEAEVEALEAANESAEVEPEDSTEEEDIEDTPTETVRDAALILVECTVERLTRKEAADATRAAAKPAEFLAWMDAFYGRHEAYLVEDLNHPCRALRACGLQILPEAVASDLCRESRERLLQVSGDCTSTTLAKAVESEVSQWSTSRPKQLIERLRA